jgi:hypothetical protein
MTATSRTRTGTVETGGITIHFTVIAATEDDRARADDIESGIRHAINRAAILPQTTITYWHETESTFTEGRVGRPTLRGDWPLPELSFPYAGRNLDIEEGA